MLGHDIPPYEELIYSGLLPLAATSVSPLLPALLYQVLPDHYHAIVN